MVFRSQRPFDRLAPSQKRMAQVPSDDCSNDGRILRGTAVWRNGRRVISIYEVLNTHEWSRTERFDRAARCRKRERFPVGMRLGAFREASGGVLFLDEVADLALDLQVKLLRALDQMTVRPLGSSVDVAVNVRVVAATSRDIKEACSHGSFREDIYYRLAGIVINVPPLRERRDDIIALALSMLEAEGAKFHLAAEALSHASWEGNVRELHHAMTQASVRALSSERSEILPTDLPDLGALHRHPQKTQGRVEAAVRNAGGNMSHAAKALGVSRATLYNLFKRYGIDPSALRAKSD
jgi:DNA-binding NtrC family response regulator